MSFPHKLNKFKNVPPAKPVVKTEEVKNKGNAQALEQFLTSWEELIEEDLNNELSLIEKRVLEEY